MSDPGSTQRCTRCGADLAPDESGLCTTCSIEFAEGAAAASRAAAPDAVAGATPDPVARATRRRRTEIAVIVVCLVVIAWRIPSFVTAVKPEVPVRSGAYTTAGSCDECVASLWKISAVLSAGESVPTSLTCPADGAAYVVEVRGGETIVSCPNPERHGLSELSVSSERPVPEAVSR